MKDNRLFDCLIFLYFLICLFSPYECRIRRKRKLSSLLPALLHPQGDGYLRKRRFMVLCGVWWETNESRGILLTHNEGIMNTAPYCTVGPLDTLKTHLDTHKIPYVTHQNTFRYLQNTFIYPQNTFRYTQNTIRYPQDTFRYSSRHL